MNEETCVCVCECDRNKEGGVFDDGVKLPFA